MFHSFQLSTFDQEDSIVIELEDGLDLQDLDGDGKSILNVPDVDSSSESDTTKGNFNDFVSSKYVFLFTSGATIINNIDNYTRPKT